MTTRDDVDDLLNESSSQVERDEISDGTNSDVAPLESSSQATSSGHSSGHNSFELFGFTKYSIAAVTCTRFIFLSALLLAAAGMATGVYKALSYEQYRDFEDEAFDSVAFQVLDAAQEHLHAVFDIMDSVAITITTYIEVQNNTNYPKGFVTMPRVEQNFGAARHASGAVVLAYVPLVLVSELGLWNEYSVANQGWIPSPANHIEPTIWQYDDNFAGDHGECNVSAFHSDQERIPVTKQTAPFAPLWTFSPLPPPNNTAMVNFDLSSNSNSNYDQAVQNVSLLRHPLLLDMCLDMMTLFHLGRNGHSIDAVIATPVFENFSNTSNIVGHLLSIIPWSKFFELHLPDLTEPVLVVLENTCGHVSTFALLDSNVTFLANADIHNPKYDPLGHSADFTIFENSMDELRLEEGLCTYNLTVYPTTEYEESFYTNKPLWYALTVLAIFVLTAVLFCVFDGLMTRQRNRVMVTAERQNAIVSSLFPKNIQAKVMQQMEADSNRLSKTGKAGLKNFLFDTNLYGEGTSKDVAAPEASAEGGAKRLDKSKPIADLFPETTIMFADIAGFTAWSSAREPTQVFILLETIYHEFDMIAKRRRVFKVEVVGDCYVAVCGLPDPRADHAVVMCKFALECVREMKRLTQDLEVELGPDTTELCLRAGLHSGPVVAGVLRGEKSRFQLFGDTMNTASRMESTGITNRVQISQETADLLIEANKKHWFELRQDKVEAKGKGELTTFLLKSGTSSDLQRPSSAYSSSDENSSAGTSLNSFVEDSQVVDKRNRIAEWTIEILAGLLKEIELRRQALQRNTDGKQVLRRLEQTATFHENGVTVISEVKEIIELPNFDAVAAKREARIDADTITLPDEVFEELRDFVQTVASMYHDNPFHNFPHANHVTMSVVKLLSRIVAPDVEELKGSLHDHTYGITSDPLTRFAVVFSALIHDVDHLGVPNTQLVKEKHPVAELYNQKSVAEQNSIDLAWDLLMESRFENLRRQIYTNESEFKRFRQLVVNSVMATDIMDKDLKELRNKRWSDAFETNQEGKEAIDRKATIVIEHLIQASDVAHTMQHWHIYRKWNERLFQEMYRAWEAGRLDQDPSLNWYKGEIGFFDFYIIPLAKKLKECGVFGVSSDEYLSYALQNRKEWEARGQDVVADMVLAANRKRVAKSVFAMAHDSVDKEGHEIIAEMSRTLRRPLSITVAQGTTNKLAIQGAEIPIESKACSDVDEDHSLDDEDDELEYGLVLK